MTNILCTKDLFNKGKCFTKGNIYQVSGYVQTAAGLMEKTTRNDLQELHVIGSFWRYFKLIK